MGHAVRMRRAHIVFYASNAGGLWGMGNGEWGMGALGRIPCRRLTGNG